MSEFMIPEKVQVANSSKYFAPVYKDASGSTAAAAAAVTAHIPEFGTLKLSTLKKLTISRGLTHIPAEMKLTFTVTTAPSAGSKLYLTVFVENAGTEFRTARPEFNNGIPLTYQIAVTDSMTATEMATAFKNAVNGSEAANVNTHNRDFIIKASSAAGVLTLTAQAPEGYNTFLRGTFFRNLSGTTSPIEFTTEENDEVSGVAIAVTSNNNGIKGVGYGADMSALFARESGNARPYDFSNVQYPIADKLYTVISYEFDVSRPDPKSSVLSSRARFILVLEEQALSSQITDFLTFLLTDTYAKGATQLDKISVGFGDDGTVGYGVDLSAVATQWNVATLELDAGDTALVNIVNRVTGATVVADVAATATVPTYFVVTVDNPAATVDDITAALLDAAVDSL